MLDIIIPVYNEGNNIKQLLDTIAQSVQTDKIIYLIYDAEEDDTLPIVKNNLHLYSFPIHLIKNHFGQGALNAIKTGFSQATSEYILVMMADLSDEPNDIDAMYSLVEHDNFDIVCASRYTKNGRQIGGPLIKRLLSRFAGISLHLLIGIPTRDVTNNFKLYRKNMLDCIKIESNGGFELGMEITIKAYIMGYLITEIPTTWTDRTFGQSKFKIAKWLMKYLKWYFWGLQKKYFIIKEIDNAPGQNSKF